MSLSYWIIKWKWVYESVRPTSNDTVQMSINWPLSQSLFFCYLCVRTNLDFPTYAQLKWIVFYMICSHVFHMSFRLSVFVVMPDDVNNRSCIIIWWIWGHHFAFWVILCHDRRRSKNRFFYDDFAGPENDLNYVLSTFVESEYEITICCRLQYID